MGEVKEKTKEYIFKKNRESVMKEMADSIKNYFKEINQKLVVHENYSDLQIKIADKWLFFDDGEIVIFIDSITGETRINEPKYKRTAAEIAKLLYPFFNHRLEIIQDY